MLFERCHSENRERSLKEHIKYFYFRSKIQLGHPVHYREKLTIEKMSDGDILVGASEARA